MVESARFSEYLTSVLTTHALVILSESWLCNTFPETSVIIHLGVSEISEILKESIMAQNN
jgi:hypothetical protein